MEHEATYEFEDENQFWTVLDETISRECTTHSSIDDTLRSYLSLIGACRERFLPSDHDLGRCAFKLQDSPLFATHAEYIRRQFVQCLIEDDDPDVILVSTSFLIADAQSNERTYELLNDEGAFPRLVDLISSRKRHGHEGIHRLLMELLYEMSRIQKIKIDDLAHIGDDFVKMLFEIIEQVSDDVNDPYHYPTIRVLLVLNEQFMVAAHDPANNQNAIPLTNKVIKVLSAHGSAYKTFGENIILLLNREDETSLQLLTLKLLYLLFTTPPTYEYFYTNDLRVLVDILIRNLLDLPEEASSLRHTYLRVLYPLLEHTQLQHPPHYKREEIRKLLIVLGGGHLSDPSGGQNSLHHWGHFDAVDETTKRLVKRCEGVSWLMDPETEPPTQAESPTDDGASNPSSPTSPSKGRPPALPAPRKLKKRNSSKGSTLTIGQYLTPQLEGARQSSLSMIEVAAQREKPGVITPSRNPSLKQNLRAAIIHKKEKPPPPPQARRSGWTRMKAQRQQSETEIANAGVGSGNGESESKLETENQLPHIHPPYPKLPPIPVHCDKEKENPLKHEPPPVPSHHRPPFKKPPPTPKARRWRGKRGKEEDEGGGMSGEPREPGKFNPSLPSIVTTTTTGERIREVSPFSPAEKTLSSPKPENAAKLAVSQALEKAQAQALEDITETLEQARIESKPEEESDEKVKAKSRQLENTIDEKDEEDDDEAQDNDGEPGIRGDHSQEELDAQFHDALPNQPLSQTAFPQPQPLDTTTTPPLASEDTSSMVPTTITPAPRMVLTPPAQEPSRGVPGPQYELERSPFLTDEEVEAEGKDDSSDDAK
ncbi:uncharacterized protein Z518_09804 [Rhinocladiella mackenziei CBS 650.93]|uniref:Rhinocladiella mackenziei CBS 650.93 unplaced genomic scaffold supercont1.8, whole genome shotgun sequence n=1 Tax=Rhinocladiella mackenziei CBS 650.93 TaxID=1442369 RepID=A0A0D2I4K8_9EURO|nr:uncharacterized protein Z518_09804 [Rhinocladiella mackenziei CBS 650.93]KIX00739.1 hypothetical protein Z518_09804 [Rhinocladiella mackenziei CBS 650.93]